MKRISLALLAIASTLSISLAATKIIERPYIGNTNATIVEIDRVELSDTATILHFEVKHRPNYWIRMASSSTIESEGKTYPLISARGIKLDSEYNMPASGRASFSMTFAPLPKGAKSFDFIEGDTDGAFRIRGVQLDKNRAKLNLDAQFTNQKLDYNAPLEDFVLTPGTARLEGRVLNHKSDIKPYSVNYMSLTDDYVKLACEVAADGTFGIDIPLATTQLINFSTPAGTCSVLLQPGKTTTINVDPGAISRNNSFMKPSGKSETIQTMYCWGPYAAINSELARFPSSRFEAQIFQFDSTQSAAIANMSTAEYCALIVDRYEKALQGLDANKQWSNNLKEVVRIRTIMLVNNLISMARYNISSAYCTVNKIEYNSDKAREHMRSLKPLDSASVVRMPKADINNLRATILGGFTYRNLYPIIALGRALNQSEELTLERAAEILLANAKLSKDEELIVREVLSADSARKQELTQSIINLVNNNKAIFSAESNKEDTQNLTTYLGSDKGVLFEINHFERAKRYIEDFNTYTPEQVAQICSSFTNLAYLSPELTKKNNAMIATLEANRKKEQARLASIKAGTATGRGSGLATIKADTSGLGYRIHKAPDVPNEELFYAIADMFADQVIFVDFWATWCGPCRSAMTAAEPVKKQLEGKDVVYIYLTDPSSPEKTWLNMIPGIHGEHFMLTQEQMDHLSKEIGIRGIPSYVIVGRDGLRKYFNTGFMGAESMKQLIEKEL